MLFAAGALLATSHALAQDPLRFAVIGDSGTGGREQQETARRMAEARQRFPFEFVLMLGDNLYGSQTPRDFQVKFERPYAPLLNDGVKFYAVLGNHDELSQRYYPLFNLRGRRYFTLAPRPDLRIIGLDSPRMDREQLRWLDDELKRSPSGWTLVFMHHPLYSSGERHGPSLDLRQVLEPLFVRGGVQAVFAGHEHFYERHEPQNGIHYFISGAAGQLRKDNIRPTPQTACGFDRDNSFMLLELERDTLRFEAIAREGTVVDRGMLTRSTQGTAADCLASR
jgi:3',5'-cyclic AMP phosphodiesterase CpdA